MRIEGVGGSDGRDNKVLSAPGAQGRCQPGAIAWNGETGIAGASMTSKSPFRSREELAASLGAQLAEGHGKVWINLAEMERAEYRKDADALIDQGLTALPTPSGRLKSAPSQEMEVEMLEWDLAQEWFEAYLTERHGEGFAIPQRPEDFDPRDWDAYLTIAVRFSPLTRHVWSQRFAERTQVQVPARVRASAPDRLPVSAPRAAVQVRRNRSLALIGAVLACRHGLRWMDLPSDVREAYVADAQVLALAGLVRTWS